VGSARDAGLCDTFRMPVILISATFYLLAAGLVVRRLLVDQGARAGFWLLTAVSAVALHALYHYLDWRHGGQVDLHFFAALSLVGLGMSALTTVYAAAGRMGALGVVVYPIAAAALLGFAASDAPATRGLDWRLELHAWFALLAYATLAVAAVLAIMLRLQERALRRHQWRGWLRVLPPLTELETLLFRSIAVGFVLLTATLLTGVLFVDDFFAQHLIHKSVLSVLSWLVFGALLYGRWRHGWRGIRAVRWTLSAMALLVLAFFGSKFMLELVLGRV
jgi:ABC-type uncharacterized transport system permease subunit